MKMAKNCIAMQKEIWKPKTKKTVDTASGSDACICIALFHSYDNLKAEKNNIQNIWEMTILLAWAQRKILQSPSPTVPFLQFYYVLNSLTLIPIKNLTSHFIISKQYTETQKLNSGKERY